MLETKVNGKEIWFCYDEIKRQYLVLFDGRMYYTDDKPVTDQDILLAEMELENVNIDVAMARFLTRII